MKKQQIAIIGLALWLIIVSIVMILTNRVDLEIFLVLGTIGMLEIVQIMESDYVQPGYTKYFRYLIAIGAMMFGIIIVLKILDFLGLEIVIL